MTNNLLQNIYLLDYYKPDLHFNNSYSEILCMRLDDEL